jgi:hypothetical protein
MKGWTYTIVVVLLCTLLVHLVHTYGSYLLQMVLIP